MAVLRPERRAGRFAMSRGVMRASTMPSEIVITIPGDPVPKGRPRMTKSGVAFTPAKTRNWESQAKWIAKQQMSRCEPFSGACEVVVVATLGMPASWPQWKRHAALQGSVAHVGRPDFDNLAKAAVDALNGVVFLDDSQITDAIVRKRYGEHPGVEVRVRETGLMPSTVKRRPEAA